METIDLVIVKVCFICPECVHTNYYKDISTNTIKCKECKIEYKIGEICFKE